MSTYFRLSLIVFSLLLVTASLSPGNNLGYQKKALAEEGYGIPPLTDNKAYMDSDSPPVTVWYLETGTIQGTYANNGQFGVGFISNPLCDGELCPSFETPENSDLEYLFAGAIWVGAIRGDDTLVSVGVDGWHGMRELWPEVSGKEFDGIGDYSVWNHFTDTITDPALTLIDPYDNRPHEPLNLRIANRAHIWYTDPENNLIIYDMVITNIGDDPIQEGYIGLHFDGDVYHMSNQSSGFQDDITGSIQDEGIAYIIDNDGDPNESDQFDYMSPTGLFAFKFLSSSFDPVDTSFDWWISNGNPALDFGPQQVDEYGNIECNYGAHTGTPTGDPFKYCIMSHPGWDYDQIFTADTTITGWTHPDPSGAIDFADGYDTKFLMSLGPFSMDPDSSIRVLYTTFAGESVHQFPDNWENLYTDPDLYLANLDFTDALNNAAVADLIAPLLINPHFPPTGLRDIYNCYDSVVIEWDPYAYEGITGYEVYLYKIPQDSMPYPDVIPPWLELSDLSVMHRITGTGMNFRYTYDTLQPSHFYFASVANQLSGTTGELCSPIAIRPGGRLAAPTTEDKYLFIEEGNLAAIRWIEPDDIDVDHYNIYKLAIWDTIPGLYYPFYDNGEFGDTAAAIDSFFVDGLWYYYYAMEPYAQTDSGIVGLSDYPDDSTTYYITAVDKSGLESEFSEPVTVFVLDLSATKEILVINCLRGTMQADRVECDSLIYFYDYTFGGLYDRYDWYDTSMAYEGLKADIWRDLIPYRMIIVDGGFGRDFLSDNPFMPTAYDLEKYIHSGGKLAYFGSFAGLRGEGLTESPAYYPLDMYWFIDQYFGVDSIFHIGLLYYFYESDPPLMDTLTGLVAAQPTDVDIPEITYNPLVNALGVLSTSWPEGTAMSPSSFKVNQEGRTIYRAISTYPGSSLIDNHPVGVKTSVLGTATYLFGFHLWYMQPDQAAMLVEYILEDSPSADYMCGDANGDFIVDIGDVVFLINYIFRDGQPPEPEIAGDTNGDLVVHVGDALYLINYIFRDGPPPECK